MVHFRIMQPTLGYIIISGAFVDASKVEANFNYFTQCQVACEFTNVQHDKIKKTD